MVLTVACFAAFDTLSKVAIGFAPVTQTLWVRYAVQAVATTVWWAVWLRPTLGLRFFRTEHPRFHLTRGLLLISCSTMTFVGLRYLPVGEFTAVAFISPMVAMMLSGWFLRDRVSRAQWWFAALSFAGAVIVIRPGSDLFGWAVVFPLALAALNAMYQLITRRLATSADEHPVFAQWVSGWIATLVLLLPLLWPGTWAPWPSISKFTPTTRSRACSSRPRPCCKKAACWPCPPIPATPWSATWTTRRRRPPAPHPPGGRQAPPDPAVPRPERAGQLRARGQPPVPPAQAGHAGALHLHPGSQQGSAAPREPPARKTIGLRVPDHKALQAAGLHGAPLLATTLIRRARPSR
jgi:drug/metabolite transporter (DMT)-like permease